MCDQEININFVLEVKKYEVLYNYTLPGYSRKDIVEKAWQQVGSKVNMTVAECKKRWRNLRTVFIRKMKSAPIGSRKNKKAYYLAEGMQFCVPFIKPMNPPSIGNLPQISQNDTTDDFLEVIPNSDISTIPEDLSERMQFFKSQPPSPKSEPLSPHEASTEEAELTQEDISPQTQSTSNPAGEKDLSVRNKSAADAERSVAGYFQAKKARMVASERILTPHVIERKEAIQMFLLSLIPEIEDFNDAQIKLFKRRVFSVIDEIV